MRKLSDKQTAVLMFLYWQKTVLRRLPTAPEIHKRLAPLANRDWAWRALAALEERGLTSRSSTAFLGADCWDITEAGLVALQRQREG